MGNLLSGLSPTAEQALKGQKLHGKVALVTGGSSGIGLEVVRVLALAGAKVVVGCPKLDKGHAAVESIRPDAGDNADISVLELDLASFRSIRSFAKTFVKEFGRLDLLVLNAAVMQTPQWATREGFEYQTGVNYFGHVELAKQLIEHLMLGQDFASRVIVVTCKLPLENPHLMQWRDLNFRNRPYSSAGAYSQSKIALAVWGSELARRLEQTNVGVFIVHPGVAVTRLNRFLPFFKTLYDAMVAPFVKTVTQAAATIIYVCSSTKLDATGSGEFFENCRMRTAPTVMSNATLSYNLWKKTDELLEHAQIDSHDPVEYNPAKQVMSRFQELFLTPLLQQFSFLSRKEKPS